MKPTPFDMKKDLAPIPFSKSLCVAARELKAKGLDWEPHVGCFVWDEKGHMRVPSPFPDRVYFILNLGHFLRIFENTSQMKAKLVWLPTWQQARLVCLRLDVDESQMQKAIRTLEYQNPEKDLMILYELILNALSNW